MVDPFPPELVPECEPGHRGGGFSPRRRALLKHLALSVISMSGVIGISHALHRDPQLAAALNTLAHRWPGKEEPSPSLPGEDAGTACPPPGAGFDPANYREFLATIPLRHISIHQVVRCHFKKRGEVTNQLPPEELWPNIVPTLLLADELGHRLNAPLLEITSAYRSPEYNAQIQGAAEGSYHLRNQALDLKFACSVSQVADMAHRMRDDGLFQGGIGTYPGFVHLDTRGRNVDWTQKAPAKG